MIKFYFLLNLLSFVDTALILCVMLAVNLCVFVGIFFYYLDKYFDVLV